MTAPSSIDPARFLHDQLSSASPDLLRSMLATFINALMSAEADAVCGAPYGMPDPGRVNVRNGYRHRDFDTRAGTLEVAIPLRLGLASSPTIRCTAAAPVCVPQSADPLENQGLLGRRVTTPRGSALTCANDKASSYWGTHWT